MINQLNAPATSQTPNIRALARRHDERSLLGENERSCGCHWFDFSGLPARRLVKHQLLPAVPLFSRYICAFDFALCTNGEGRFGALLSEM
jgi:hypothetical protein